MHDRLDTFACFPLHHTPPDLSMTIHHLEAVSAVQRQWLQFSWELWLCMGTHWGARGYYLYCLPLAHKPALLGPGAGSCLQCSTASSSARHCLDSQAVIAAAHLLCQCKGLATVMLPCMEMEHSCLPTMCLYACPACTMVWHLHKSHGSAHGSSKAAR